MASFRLSLGQSGAGECHDGPGADYPMESEHGGDGVRFDLPPGEQEEPAPKEGAQPQVSTGDSLLNALSEAAHDKIDESPNQVIPNIEVKCNSKSRK